MIHRILAAVLTAFLVAAPAGAAEPAVGPTGPPLDVTEGPVCGPVPCAADCSPEACPGELFWARGDYLLGFFRPTTLPVLVTTSPLGTPQMLAGVLGQSSSLIGATKVNFDLRSGFRLEAGYWLDANQRFAIEGGFSMLESQSTTFAVSSPGTVILARPFTSAADGSAQSVLVSFPGFSSGGVEVRATSGNFYEAHVDLAERFRPCDWLCIDGLIGYRFYEYRDGVRIQQTILPANPNFVPGTVVTGIDDFNARNDFNGCDIGVRAQMTFGSLGVELLAKTAFGRLYQSINIGGGQTVSVPGVPPVTTVGGLYAQAPNIGLHTQNDFELMPELGATLSWKVSDNLRLRVGYSLIFLGGVVRAGDQINETVNPTLFQATGQGVGGAAVPFHETSIWIQTLNFGAEISF